MVQQAVNVIPSSSLILETLFWLSREVIERSVHTFFFFLIPARPKLLRHLNAIQDRSVQTLTKK